MKKIILFSKLVYEKMPQNYRDKVNTFILEVIRNYDKELACSIEKKECTYEFSDFYYDKDDEGMGDDINESIRMKFSSDNEKIVECFCTSGKGKSFFLDGVHIKMTTCFDVISNVNEYMKCVSVIKTAKK